MTVAVSSASAGTVGFIVVVLLGLATYGLLRSMNTRIRNVRRNAAEWPAAEAPSSPPDTSATTSPSEPQQPSGSG